MAKNIQQKKKTPANNAGVKGGLLIAVNEEIPKRIPRGTMFQLDKNKNVVAINILIKKNGKSERITYAVQNDRLADTGEPMSISEFNSTTDNITVVRSKTPVTVIRGNINIAKMKKEVVKPKPDEKRPEVVEPKPDEKRPEVVEPKKPKAPEPGEKRPRETDEAGPARKTIVESSPDEQIEDVKNDPKLDTEQDTNKKQTEELNNAIAENMVTEKTTPPSGTTATVNGEVAPAPPTEFGDDTNKYSRLSDQIAKLTAQLKETEDRIAEIDKSRMADGVKIAEKEQEVKRKKDEVELGIEQNLKVGVNDHTKESAENELAAGELSGETPVTNVQTGSHVNADPREIIRPEAIDNTKDQSLLHNNQIDDMDIVNTDSNNNSRNRQTLLSSYNIDNQLIGDGEKINSESTSANAVEVSVDTDVIMKDTPELTEMLEKERKRLNAESIAIQKDVLMSDDVRKERIKDIKLKIKKNEERIAANKKELKERAKAVETKRKILAEFDAKLDKEKEEISKRRAEFEAAGGHIHGMAEFALDVKEHAIIKDEKDPRAIARLSAALQKVAEVDVTTMQSNITEDDMLMTLAEDALQRGLGSQRMGQDDVFDVPLGDQAYGTSITVPDKSRGILKDMQQLEVLKITNSQATAIRKELVPYWNEFKLSRLNSGIQEAAIMGTKLFKSDNSSFKISKVRSDMTSKEESFGNFMFFVLHHKFGKKNHRGGMKWRKFLMWSAALGFNKLTSAQINWLVTGNKNGDLSEIVDFSKDKSILDEQIELFEGEYVGAGSIYSLDIQTESIQEPAERYPSRSVSPSAAPVDNSIHPDGSTSVERIMKRTTENLPNRVLNIPDPRTSRRGGEDIQNVRTYKIRNRKYDPKLKPDDPKYEPEYIDVDVPDIGVGSKDIQAQIEQSEADRLIDAQPQRLYAPIHPQACDRYLGARNYKRLTIPNSKYMKSYSQHGWTETDYPEMFAWNSFVMTAFGSMLYAFVTDINMQRDRPVFDLRFPASVVTEFKELNELIKELKRYQEKSEDRADRIEGGGVGARPIEKALNEFFDKREQLDNEEGLQPPNAIVIAGDSPFSNDSGSGSKPDNPTPDNPTPDNPTPNNPTPDKPTPDPTSDPTPDVSRPTEQVTNPEKFTIDNEVMNFGVKKMVGMVQGTVDTSSKTSLKSEREMEADRKRRRMYNMFKRR